VRCHKAPSFLGTRRVGYLPERYCHTSLRTKKSAPGELQIVQRAHSCRRKRIAAPSRRKSGSPRLCHTCLASRRDRRSFDDRLSAIACPGGGARLPHGAKVAVLRAVLVGGEKSTRYQSFATEIIRQYQSSVRILPPARRVWLGWALGVHTLGWMHVHDQDRLVASPGLGKAYRSGLVEGGSPWGSHSPAGRK